MPSAVQTDPTPPSQNSTSSVIKTTQLDQTRPSEEYRLGSESPPPLPRPPVSPISPSVSLVLPATALQSSSTPSAVNTVVPPQPPFSNAQKQQQPPQKQKPPPQTEFIDPPAPVPLEIDDNTDAAALRAAISILQIQREKSKQDIKNLQKLRHGLVKNPDHFTQELLSGKLKEEKLPNDPLQATFNGGGEEDDQDGDEEDKEDVEMTDDKLAAANSLETPPPSTRYPKIPAAQNVIRCPPVNWAKYHIAGEPLDRMHDAQRKMPAAGEPTRDMSHLQQPPQQPPQSYAYGMASASRTSEHQVYAPYDPQLDRTTTVAEQMGIGVQTRRSSKKPDAGAAGFG